VGLSGRGRALLGETQEKRTDLNIGHYRSKSAEKPA
jgi:hypothetical protein